MTDIHDTPGEEQPEFSEDQPSRAPLAPESVDAHRPTEGPGSQRDIEYKGTGFAWSWLGWLIIVIAILPVVVQNTQIVQVRYLIWDIRAPLAAAFLAVAVIAEVATEIIGWAWRARRRRELTMKAELRELRRKTAPDA